MRPGGDAERTGSLSSLQFLASSASGRSEAVFLVLACCAQEDVEDLTPLIDERGAPPTFPIGSPEAKDATSDAHARRGRA